MIEKAFTVSLKKVLLIEQLFLGYAKRVRPTIKMRLTLRKCFSYHGHRSLRINVFFLIYQ
jgi:hypothetical protein